MRKSEFEIRLMVSCDIDAALVVLTEAKKYCSFDKEKFLIFRLVVHEAVLNALKYGGGDVVLTALGNKEKIQVEIRQKNKIVFPVETKPYQGTSLIRRYACETELSDDGKALIMRFY